MLKYKYEKGYILKGKNSDIVFEEQTYVFTKRGTRKSAYKYRCCKCGNVDVITQDSIPRGYGCNACSGKVLKVGINDINTTNPHIAELMKKSDRCKYTSHSNADVEFRCPICKKTSIKKINNVTNYGFHCPHCSDGVSVPEKFAISILKYFNIDYIYQYSKTNREWVGSYKYDFYLPTYDCILEVHGSQHFEECQFTKKQGGLNEVQKNDENKKTLALNYVEKYIEIDCRRTELNFMKKSFSESELSKIINFSTVDWDYIFQNFYNTNIQSICDLYNNGFGVMDIARKMNMDKETIRNHLLKGADLKLCDYSTKDKTRQYTNSVKKAVERCSKRVKCNETGKIYSSCAECDRDNNLSKGSTSACATGKRKSSNNLTFTFI